MEGLQDTGILVEREGVVVFERMGIKEAEELHYDAKTANAKGFFFRINGQNCKITNYKGSETDIQIPDTINGKPVKEIRIGAFAGKNIRSVIFPKNLLRIREEAFRGCDLEELQLPARVECIEKNAFGDCEKLAKVNLHPDGKRNIEVSWKAFAETPFIKSATFVTLGDMLLRINLFGRKDELHIPRDVKYIKKGAAHWKPEWRLLGVERLFIPANVKELEDEAFASLIIAQVQVETIQKYHYIRLGKDVFGTTYLGGPFKERLIQEKLGDIKGFAGYGWQCLKELEIVTQEWGCSSFGRSNIYIPRSKKYEFVNCLQIQYRSLHGFYFKLTGRDYYELMLQVHPFDEKIEMAKFFAYHYCGSMIREGMLQFLKRYEKRAWKYAVKKKDNVLIYLYQHYGFWKEKENF